MNYKIFRTSNSYSNLDSSYNARASHLNTVQPPNTTQNPANIIREPSIPSSLISYQVPLARDFSKEPYQTPDLNPASDLCTQTGDSASSIQLSTPELPTSDYNLHKIADIEVAKIHGLAQRVRKLDSGAALVPQSSRCPCCKVPIVSHKQDGPKYNLDCEIVDLAHLGSGFPMYFYFTRSLGYLMIYFFLFVGVICLLGNILHDGLEDGTAVSRTTIGNYGEDDIPLYQIVLHFLAGLSFIAYFIYFIRKMMTLSVQVEVLSTDASDFAIWVDRLPDNYSTDDVKKYFESQGRFDKKLAEVVSVIPIYNIAEQLSVVQELSQLKLFKEYDQKMKSNGFDAKQEYKYLCYKSKKHTASKMIIQDIDKRLQELEIKRADILRLQTSNLKTNQALITFRHQLDAKQIIEDRSRSLLGRLIDILRYCLSMKNWRFYGDSLITIKPAPEPTDIYWDNMSVSRWHTFIRRLISNSLTSVVVFLSFYIEIILSVIKVEESNTVELEGKLIRMEIINTPGQERFRAGFPSSHYNKVHGIILVYNVTSRESFNKVEILINEINRIITKEVPMLIVGNGCDMEGNKVVSYDEGKELADRLGVKFLETSAKTAQNVEEAFLNIAYEMKMRADSI